jgi:hypothetical protein
MAGDWIKMRVGLCDDPAVVSIAHALDMDEHAVVGRLHRIWSWADQHLSDGNARGVTQSWIDRYVGAPGFAKAMQLAGWLRIESDKLVFPNFDRHNLKTGKRRALTAERAAKHRGKRNADSNAGTVTESAPTEEKRREEKITKGVNPLKPPRGSQVEVSDVEIPAELDTPDVRQALADWLAFKRKRRQAYTDGKHLSLRLKAFAASRASPDEFVERVNAAIGNNWQGIPDPKGTPHHGRHKQGAGQNYDPNAKRDPNVGTF